MEKKLSSELKFNGKVVQVYEDVVEVKNHHAYRDVVRHPGGVGILLIIDDNVLLVKQYRYVVDQELLEIPAGKLEGKEDPYKAAMRELEEESGYTCDSLNTLATLFPSPGILDEKLIVYEAINPRIVDHPMPMDEDEEITTHWVSINEVMRMIRDGSMKDAKSVIAVQTYLLNQNQKISR